MPDIKHNFTRGKMNKDHDERLVANGEYRDAMNIQVSTSDDSDIGTVQNILGNRMIGVEFWNANLDSTSRCVGSIADEKDNKIYYFVNNKGDEQVTNTALLNGNGWISGPGITKDYSGDGVLIGSTAGVSGQWSGLRTNLDLVDGHRYIFTITVSEVDNDGASQPIKAWVGGDPYSSPAGDSSYRPTDHPNNRNHFFDGDEGTVSTIFDFDQSQNNDVPDCRLYIELTNGHQHDKVIRISNPSVMEVDKNFILQYDTKKDIPPFPSNTISDHPVIPVFVDRYGEVLKFSREDRIITGINIIDDMLFWTDGTTEPKKINIPRCIEGTNPDGSENTYIINPAQGLVPDVTHPYGQEVMKEEHVTVIKKYPIKSPTIINETIRDKTKQYTAFMTISENHNTDNDFLNSSEGIIHDFQFLRVGSTFRTKLNNPDMGSVILEWKNGDEVVLKEYDSTGTPELAPITEYRIKGTVTNWHGNKFATTNPLINANGTFSKGGMGQYQAVPDNWIIPQWSYTTGTLQQWAP